MYITHTHTRTHTHTSIVQLLNEKLCVLVQICKEKQRDEKCRPWKSNTKLASLEAEGANPDNIRIAQGLASKLKSLDAEFRTHHLSIIDLFPIPCTTMPAVCIMVCASCGELRLTNNC